MTSLQYYRNAVRKIYPNAICIKDLFQRHGIESNYVGRWRSIPYLIVCESVENPNIVKQIPDYIAYYSNHYLLIDRIWMDAVPWSATHYQAWKNAYLRIQEMIVEKLEN